MYRIIEQLRSGSFSRTLQASSKIAFDFGQS